jgi:parallel beta-helix repeat protein
MRMTRGALLIAILFVITVLSLSALETHPVAATLSSHPPILIDGNNAFTSGNGVSGGHGSLLDPYLIKDLNITDPVGTGIDIRNTTSYFFIRNVLVSGSQYGISLTNVTNADVENSTLSNNQHGIILFSSRSSLIFNNNFISNAVQANDNLGFDNFWDNGYYSPSGGGNYWSDYTGIDKCYGISQSVCTGPDGIGDTPYRIPGTSNSQDYYPLMTPYIPDTTPPNWPAGNKLTVYRVTPTSLTLNWTAATDDVGVVSYTVYKGGTILQNVTSTLRELNVTGLTQATTYNFSVKACDRATNCSNGGPSLTITTPAAPLSPLTIDFWIRNWYLILVVATAVAGAVLLVILKRWREPSQVLSQEKQSAEFLT